MTKAEPRLLSLERINQLAAEPRYCSRMQPEHPVDAERPWVPENYTQLYFTPLYRSLSDTQRLRYNQLFALRINEYIMMLESDLIDALLPPLLQSPALRNDAALAQAVRTMVEEEHQHCAGFAALNRLCRPDLYPAGQDRYFSQLPAASRILFGIVGNLSRHYAFALWYLMAMEESSKSLARDMSRQPETETLGRLDAGFMSVHVQHLKDETRHLHIDQHLITRCIPRRKERLNAWLFTRMLGGVLHISRKGSGVRVIHQLVRDCPELASRQEELIQAVLALKGNRQFVHSLFNRHIMPHTFHMHDQVEAFARLGERMAGYDRQTS